MTYEPACTNHERANYSARAPENTNSDGADFLYPRDSTPASEYLPRPHRNPNPHSCPLVKGDSRRLVAAPGLGCSGFRMYPLVLRFFSRAKDKCFGLPNRQHLQTEQ